MEVSESKEAGRNGMERSRLKGMKIRAEFMCPITHDLIRDPVVLADGK